MVDRNEVWIYRGHTESEWWPKNSLERLLEELGTNEHRKIAEQLFADFRSKAGLFESKLPSEDDYLGWLALMQHHGVPTTLIDWTYSPWVAAYFAFRDVQADSAKHCSVWAINLRALEAGLKSLMGTHDRRQAYERAETLIRKRYSRRLRLQPDLPFILPYWPREHNRRLAAQQGIFLVNSLSDCGFLSTLREMHDLSDAEFIRRFHMPWSFRRQALCRLEEMNVHELSLFPDLTGLGTWVGHHVRHLVWHNVLNKF
jgi:hypothetical protein